jgi:hypothetical protein
MSHSFIWTREQLKAFAEERQATMNTNDEQAKYGTPEERDALQSTFLKAAEAMEWWRDSAKARLGGQTKGYTVNHEDEPGIEGMRVPITFNTKDMEQTKREPMLSDEAMEALRHDYESWSDMMDVRAWYESKITSGELVVVKQVEWDHSGNKCKSCNWGNDGIYQGTNYCGGCGGKIVKP